MTASSTVGSGALAAGGTGDQGVINAFLELIADKTPYLWGGINQFGADCSGAVKFAFAKAGYTFGARRSQDQANLGIGVPLAGANKLANAKPGDVLFFDEPGEGPNSHEALYAGNGMDYEESHSGTDAREIPVDTVHLEDIRRFISTTGGVPYQGVNGSALTVPAVSDAGTPGAQLDSKTSILSDLTSTKAWSTIGGEILLVAGGLGLVVLGIYKTAAPGGN